MTGRRFECPTQAEPTLYDFTAFLLSGERVSLNLYRGRVVLIVNTASKCGFTQQFAGIEELYRVYKDRGLMVLGFPCNQFAAQEPGTAEEIGTFCQANYGVSFAMFARIDVNGPQEDPIYRFLKQKKSGILGMRSIKWNFTKFLVSRQGDVVARYAPATEPKRLAKRIEGLLEDRRMGDERGPKL